MTWNQPRRTKREMQARRPTCPHQRTVRRLDEPGRRCLDCGALLNRGGHDEYRTAAHRMV